MGLTQLWAQQYMQWQNRTANDALSGKPLMESPLPTLLILVSYYLAIFIGPRIMKNREAWDLRTYTQIYNILQLIFCAVYVTKLFLLTEINPKGLFLMCKILDRSDSPTAREIHLLMYVNLIARYIELSETVIYILRKKDRQLSYLHVIHHSFNVIVSWGLCRFHPGGTSATICLINFFVHFIMFSYYLASSSANKRLKKFSTIIKKYITIIQMVQFIYMLVILLQDWGLYPPCKANTFMTQASFFTILIDLLLFINFYRVNYLKQKKT